MEPTLTIGLLVTAAMVLAFLEILTPSFGVLAAGAVATLIAAIWMSFAQATWLGYVMILASFVGGIAYVAILVKLLPKTPIGKRMFLSKAPDATGQGTPEAGTYDEMIGKTGTTASLLRPGGMVQIDSKRLPAHAETGMIEKDVPVVVVGADSMNVIVRKAENR
ncbi:MAG: hypothetical protein GY794_23140 [bacterium]|nr:hypothetical protein [bacterium]